MDKACAYCGRVGNLTKEHLIPRCILKRTPHYTSQFLDASRSGFIQGEATIGDVCRACNSQVLSDLDEYFCGVYDKWFARKVSPNSTKEFSYNFPMLSRWLLKTSYNVARTKTGDEAAVLRASVPYVLSSQAYLRFALFVEIVAPRVLTPDEEATLDKSVRDELPRRGQHCMIPPNMVRVSSTVMPSHFHDVICRLVAINAFYFYLLLPRSAEMLPKIWQRRRREFHSLIPESTQLVAGSRAAILRQSSRDVFSSYAPTIVKNLGRFAAAFGPRIDR